METKNYDPMVRDILNEVADVVEKKNHDYDSAFDKAYSRIGATYAAGKVYEKTERIITLTIDRNMVEGEGLEDALKDCIGYCALYLRRLRVDEQINAWCEHRKQ